MSRVKKMENTNLEKLQRSIDEAKHLHDALNVMRGDLRESSKQHLWGGLMDGWMDGWLDGWMDGRVSEGIACDGYLYA